MKTKSRIPTPKKSTSRLNDSRAGESYSKVSEAFKTPQKTKQQSLIPVKTQKNTPQMKRYEIKNENREDNRSSSTKYIVDHDNHSQKSKQHTPKKLKSEYDHTVFQKGNQSNSRKNTIKSNSLKCDSKETFEINSCSVSEFDDKQDYEKMFNRISTEAALFARNLSGLNIKAKIVNDVINKEIGEILYKKLIDIDPTDYHFCISGQHLSGKTSILFKIAELTFKRVQIVQSTIPFFVLPLNFSRMNFKDPIALYHDIINQVVNAAQHHCLEMIPYADALRQWFASFIRGSSVDQPPSFFSLIPNFNVKKLWIFGKRINSIFKYRDGLDEFVKLIFTFPNVFASSLGDRHPLYFIDNFDNARQLISKVPIFPDYFKVCQYYPHVMNMISDNPYVITATDIIEIMPGATIIELAEMCNFEGPTIFCPSPMLVIQSFDCEGYPGYLDYYITIIEAIKHFLSAPKLSHAGSNLAMCYKSKNVQIKKMIETLLTAFLQNGHEKMKPMLLAISKLDVADIKLIEEDEIDEM